MLSGKDNFYAYVSDVNTWIDPFGLEVLRNELVYQLLDDGDNVIYYGITSRKAWVRLGEHEDGDKVFTRMEVLYENLTHDEARSLEGALIRQRIGEYLTALQQADLSVLNQLKAADLINKIEVQLMIDGLLMEKHNQLILFRI